jgi:hypothetical protein
LDDCRKPLTSKYGMTRQLQLKRGILQRWRSTTRMRLWPENRALLCRPLLLLQAALDRFIKNSVVVQLYLLNDFKAQTKSCSLRASWYSLCILVWNFSQKLGFLPSTCQSARNVVQVLWDWNCMFFWANFINCSVIHFWNSNVLFTFHLFLKNTVLFVCRCEVWISVSCTQ